MHLIEVPMGHKWIEPTLRYIYTARGARCDTIPGPSPLGATPLFCMVTGDNSQAHRRDALGNQSGTGDFVTQASPWSRRAGSGARPWRGGIAGGEPSRAWAEVDGRQIETSAGRKLRLVKLNGMSASCATISHG